jgi:hypothetical protein
MEREGPAEVPIGLFGGQNFASTIRSPSSPETYLFRKVDKMLPMSALRLSLGSSLAANATYLAPASLPNAIALIIAPFTPNENLTLAALTLATFTGSTPIDGIAGAQEVSIDPVTLQQKITIKPPAGGWRFACTAGSGLPQTIYGYALVDNAVAVLLGVQVLPTPITITASGQAIDLGVVEMDFVAQPIS